MTDYGLWNQIRVDYGKEWYLMLAVQQSLADMRNDVNKPCYLQTPSKKVAMKVFEN